jgi:hypothetical protein
MEMTKQDVVNNGWMTDVAIASDDKVTLDSDLFKAHITHPDVYSALYGDDVVTTTVDDEDLNDETGDDNTGNNEDLNSGEDTTGGGDTTGGDDTTGDDDNEDPSGDDEDLNGKGPVDPEA